MATMSTATGAVCRQVELTTGRLSNNESLLVHGFGLNSRRSQTTKGTIKHNDLSKRPRVQYPASPLCSASHNERTTGHLSWMKGHPWIGAFCSFVAFRFGHEHLGWQPKRVALVNAHFIGFYTALYSEESVCHCRLSFDFIQRYTPKNPFVIAGVQRSNDRHEC